MVFVVDDFAAWLIGLLAEAGRRRLASFVLGSDQERALRAAAAVAVQLTAADLCPQDDERSAQLAMVVNEVFAGRLPQLSNAGPLTLLQALQAGISEGLAPLDDPGITGTGQSSAELFQLPAGVLAERLTARLLEEILGRGAKGDPLAPVANQLNHDVTHLQGKRIEGMLSRLAEVVLETLARLETGPPLAASASPARGSAELRSSSPGQLPRSRHLFRPIEMVLRLARSVQPEFGRVAGPAWVDFESGYHPFTAAQAALITDSLKKQRFHLVIGSSGAWREHFTRYLGWYCAKRQFKVFYTDFSIWADDIQAADFSPLDTPNTCLIVDNVHANPVLCEDLLAILEDTTASLKCIFSSDPAIGRALIHKPYFKSDLIALASTTLSSSDEAVNLVTRYAEKKLGRRVGSGVTQTFMEASRIRRRQTLFYQDEDEAADHNLWLLLTHLRDWDGRAMQSASKLSQRSRSYVDEAITGPLLNIGVPVAALSTVVAHFHHLGVGAPLAFLTSKLGFTLEEISTTERQGVIAQKDRTVWLTDDHLPYPLQEAGIHRHEIQDDIVRRLGLDLVDEPQLLFALENAFITSGFPGYDLVLLNGGSFASSDAESFVLLRHSWSNEIDRTAIERLVQAERSPMVLGRVLVALARRDPSFASLLSHRLNLPALNRSVSTVDSSRAIAWLVEGLNRIAPAVAQELVMSFDKKALAHRLRIELNLGTIASLLWAVRNADAEGAKLVAGFLSADEWVRKVSTEKYGAHLGWFLFVINDISGPTAQEVISRLGVQTLSEAIKSRPTCRDVAALLWGAVNTSLQIASALARTVPQQIFSDCITYETNLVFSAMLLRSLAAADGEVAVAVTRLLDLHSLTERVTDEADENAAALFLLGLSEAAPMLADPVVFGVQVHVRAEEMSAAMAQEMFSRANLSAFNRASRRRDRAAHRLSTIDGFRVAADAVSPGERRSKRNSDSMWALWTYDPARCTTTTRNKWNEIADLLVNSTSILARTKLAIIMFDSDPRRFELLLESVPQAILTTVNIGEIEPAMALAQESHAEPVATLLSKYSCTETEAINITSSVDYRILEAAIVAMQPVNPELALKLIERVDCTQLLMGGYRRTRDRAVSLILRAKPECIQTLIRLVADEAQQKDGIEPECKALKRFGDAQNKLSTHSDDAKDLIEVLWNEIGCTDGLDKCSDLGTVAQTIRTLRYSAPAMAEHAVNAMSLERLESRLQVAEPDRWAADCIHEVSRTSNTLFLRLMPVVSGLIKDHPTFGIIVLDGLPHGKPGAKTLIADLGSETLRRMVAANSSIPAVARALKVLAEHSPGTAKAVAEDLKRDFLPLILGKPNELRTLSHLLEVLQQIDSDIARYAASCISPRHLSAAIQRRDSLSALSVQEGIGLIASLNVELTEAIAQDLVAAYVHSDAAGSSQFYYAAKILSSLADVDMNLLKFFVSRIDMSIMAHSLQKITGHGQEVWGLDLFLRLVMSVDVTKVEQLHRLVPRAITTGALNDAAEDSLGIEWERAIAGV